MSYDVIVVGGGLSGYVAAAKAAQMGKRVLLLKEGTGCFPFLSGCIDLWGYPDEREPATDPVAEIDRHLAADPLHPYGRLRDVLDDSLAFLREACEPYVSYAPPGGRNITVPTPLGMPRPAFLAPKSQYRTGWEAAQKIVLVGFREYRDFFPSLVAANINRWRGEGAVSLMVTLGLPRHVDAPTLARLLEKEAYWRLFVEQVAARAGGASLILAPAVFGLESSAELLSRLGRILGTPLMEMATLPPGVPGLRLYRALHRYVLARGGEVTGNIRVTGAESAAGACRAVTACDAVRQRRYEGRSFVLATGSFVSGGFAGYGDGVIEPVMHLPVYGRGEVSGDEPFLSRRGKDFMKVGLLVDENLHPLDEKGRVLYDNVFVTGAKLAGCDHAVEKCGTGVAVASGYKAGLKS